MDRILQSRAPNSGHYGVASDKGGERIANVLTLIETAKMHGHNPETYFTHVLTVIRDYPEDRLHELLPWVMAPATPASGAAA